MRYIATLHSRPSVHGGEPYPTRGDRFQAEHSGTRGVTLKKNPQSYGVSAVPMG